jgi:hypothetical protein
MCSLTLNAAANMTGCPQADLPPREQTTQVHPAIFSACFPACSPAARATDNPGPPKSRDRTQIASLATYLKMYVIIISFLPHAHSDTAIAHSAHLSLFLFCFAAASTPRGRAASPGVVLARLSMRRRSRLYHRQRSWPRRWRLRRESTRGHSGC